MLSILRTNQILTGVFLLPYAALLYASVFFIPAESREIINAGIFSDWVYGLLGTNATLHAIVVIVLLWLQSFLINDIGIENRIQSEQSLFAGLFYILLCSCISDFKYLSPELMGNTFFIIAVGQLMKTYQKKSVADHIFNVGFWLGIAGLFYFSFVYVFFWGIIGVSSLRVFRLKEAIQNLFGFLTPYILVGTSFFFTGQFGDFWNKAVASNTAFMGFYMSGDIASWVKIGIVAIVVIIALLSYGSFVKKKIMQVQRKIGSLYSALFVITLTVFFQANIQVEHLLLYMVPLSFFVAMLFMQMKRNTAEALHLILVIAVLVFSFSPLFI